MGLYLIHESSVCFATNMVYNTLLQARISKVPLEELKERYRLSRGYEETLIKRISACWTIAQYLCNPSTYHRANCYWVGDRGRTCQLILSCLSPEKQDQTLINKWRYQGEAKVVLGYETGERHTMIRHWRPKQSELLPLKTQIPKNGNQQQ